ncbi:hypothetical protein IJT17_03960, partial [bacterium]|nr:hypothetical protein [bacterium]
LKLLWRFISGNYLIILIVLWLLCQIGFIASGQIDLQMILSNTDDEIALQGKNSSSKSYKEPKLAGRQNKKAGTDSDVGGIPVAFGENAPEVLPARFGGPRSFNDPPDRNNPPDGDNVPSDNNGRPALLSAQRGASEMPSMPSGVDEERFGASGDLNGVSAPDGRPNAEGEVHEFVPGAQRADLQRPSLAFSADATPGSDGNNNAEPENKDDLKAADAASEKQTAQPRYPGRRIESGAAYVRGLRAIYYLEKRGGRFALSRVQAKRMLSLIEALELERSRSIAKEIPVPEVPDVASPSRKRPAAPKIKSGASKEELAYAHTFMLLYHLEKKGGKYSLTDKQAEQILRIIKEAEGMRSLVPNAQRELPKILTPEQLGFIRSKLSASAASGMRSDPSQMESYANEVLELTK